MVCQTQPGKPREFPQRGSGEFGSLKAYCTGDHFIDAEVHVLHKKAQK